MSIAGGSAVGALGLYVVRAELRGDVNRLDGRINAHERQCGERQKNLDERHAMLTGMLERMDQKLDTLMERL